MTRHLHALAANPRFGASSGSVRRDFSTPFRYLAARTSSGSGRYFRTRMNLTRSRPYSGSGGWPHLYRSLTWSAAGPYARAGDFWGN